MQQCTALRNGNLNFGIYTTNMDINSSETDVMLTAKISETGIAITMDDPGQWSYKEICGLLEVSAEDSQFIVAVDRAKVTLSGGSNPDAIKEQLLRMTGKYVKLVIAMPTNSYALMAYNWVTGTVDNRKPKPVSIELLPVQIASCQIISIDNRSRLYTIIDAWVDGQFATFAIMTDNPKYFEICEKLNPGELVRIHNVLIDDKRIITDISDLVKTRLHVQILGCRKFTLDSSGSVEIVCAGDRNERFMSPTRPDIIAGKKYIITYIGHPLYNGWFIVVDIAPDDS